MRKGGGAAQKGNHGKGASQKGTTKYAKYTKTMPGRKETTEYTEYTELQGLSPPLHPAKAQGALPQFLKKEKGFVGVF